MRSGIHHGGIWLYALMAFLASFEGRVDAFSRVDALVESVRVQPTRPTADLLLTVTAVLRNSGSEPAEDLFVSVEIKQKSVRVLKVDDVPVLSELPRSGAGLSVPVAIGRLPEGEYVAEVTVRSRKNIEESNVANNVRTVSFRVFSAPRRVTYTNTFSGAY